MSRIGKKPIQIPTGVEVKIDGSKVFVKGAKGSLEMTAHPAIEVKIEGSSLTFTPKYENNDTKALWGLTRALVQNMINGVTNGYEKRLEIQGIGYGATVEGGNLVLKVGYTHPVKIAKEQGIDFKVEKNIVIVSGIDKEKVGNIAAKIRATRKPEPYLGKGIRYQGEAVRKKLGKKAAKAA